MLDSAAKIKIVTIRVGICNCFLIIQNKKCLLVDTGVDGRADIITKAIMSRGLLLSDLEYIFLTHTHYDHAGNVSILKKVTGAKVIVNKREVKYLEKGFHHIPKGTSTIFKILVSLGKVIERSRTHFKPSTADITFDEKLDLKQLGFDATIYHTPGHTSGSSIILTNKRVLAGDSVFNYLGKIFPPFANNKEELLLTWKMMLNLKASHYYPSHGKRISYSVFENAYNKKQKNSA